MANSVFEEICRINHKLNECIDKINSLDLINGSIANFVTPEMYGAKGDGVSDDIVPIQKALATLKPCRLDKNYLISTPLTVDSYNILEINGSLTYTQTTGSAIILTGEKNIIRGRGKIASNGHHGLMTKGVTHRNLIEISEISCSTVNARSVLYLHCFDGENLSRFTIRNTTLKGGSGSSKIATGVQIETEGSGYCNENLYDRITTASCKLSIDIDVSKSPHGTNNNIFRNIEGETSEKQIKTKGKIIGNTFDFRSSEVNRKQDIIEIGGSITDSFVQNIIKIESGISALAFKVIDPKPYVLGDEAIPSNTIQGSILTPSANILTTNPTFCIAGDKVQFKSESRQASSYISNVVTLDYNSVARNPFSEIFYISSDNGLPFKFDINGTMNYLTRPKFTLKATAALANGIKIVDGTSELLNNSGKVEAGLYNCYFQPNKKKIEMIKIG